MSANKETRKELLKEDRVVEFLERGQLWLECNFRWILGAVLAVLLASATFHFFRHAQRKEADALQVEASRLKGLDESRLFLQRHPRAEAAALVYLSVIRQELDAREFKSAFSRIDDFQKAFPAHPQAALAELLKAYACEELDRREEAIAACKRAVEKAAAKGDQSTRAMADAALARLQSGKG